MANSTTVYSLPDGRRAIDVTEAKTLAITDQGIVQVVKYDNAVITLPSTVVGYSFTIANGGVPKTSGPTGTGDNGSAKVSVSPAALDLIAGGEIATAADDKDYINTKATARVGDEVRIVGNGTTGWNVVGQKGIWAREA